MEQLSNIEWQQQKRPLTDYFIKIKTNDRDEESNGKSDINHPSPWFILFKHQD